MSVKRYQYDEQSMLNGIEAVRQNNVLISSASRNLNVTLDDKIKQKSLEGKKIGPATVLSQEEEEIFLKWTLSMAKAGFPISKSQLLDCVKVFIILFYILYR